MPKNVKKPSIVVTTTTQFFCDCGKRARKTLKHVPDQTMNDCIFIEATTIPIPDGWELAWKWSESGPGQSMKFVCPDCQEGDDDGNI